MPTLTLLTNISGFLKEIEEAKRIWIDSILLELGLDVDLLNSSPPDISIEYFMDNAIDIINYPDIDAVKIERDGEIIAEWAGPEFLKKIDEDGLPYYSIDIENWSIFD